ncbi:unnamed protein product, partial [Polarella glacialis]
ARGAQEQRVVPSAAPTLRELMLGAPRELCCALDGKLLIDPVRSPDGALVFERANLSKALALSSGLCPVTGQPLSLADCPRAGDLRLEAARWVRQARPMQRQIESPIFACRH